MLWKGCKQGDCEEWQDGDPSQQSRQENQVSWNHAEFVLLLRWSGTSRLWCLQTHNIKRDKCVTYHFSPLSLILPPPPNLLWRKQGYFRCKQDWWKRRDKSQYGGEEHRAMEKMELTGGPGLPSKPEAPWTDGGRWTKTRQEERGRGWGGKGEGKGEVSEAVTPDKHMLAINKS